MARKLVLAFFVLLSTTAANAKSTNGELISSTPCQSQVVPYQDYVAAA